MQRMTVLYVIDELCIGGAQELLVLLARHTSRECRSVVCSLQGGDAVQKRLEQAGAEVHVFGRQRPSLAKPHKVIEYFVRSLLDILKMCSCINPDVIHCHLSDAVLLGGAVSFFVKKTKIVVTKHTPIMLPKRGCLSIRNLLRKVLLWFCYKTSGCCCGCFSRYRTSIATIFCGSAGSSKTHTKWRGNPSVNQPRRA